MNGQHNKKEGILFRHLFNFYRLHIYLYLKNLINKINNLDKYLLSFG